MAQTIKTEQQWNLRPGIFKERMIRIFLFMLGIDAGIMICLLSYDSGPKGITALALWGLPIFLGGLLLGFKAAALLISLLQAKGIFGKIQLNGSRLEAGSGSSVIHLARPFGLDARVQDKNPRQVLAAVMLQQDEKWVTLYCCGTYDTKKRKIKEDYFEDEPDLQKKEILPAKGRALQLEPADFIEVFRLINKAEKINPLQHVTVETREKRVRDVLDPRKHFCSNLQTAIGASLIVLLAIIPPFIVITQSTAAGGSNDLHAGAVSPAPEDHTPPVPGKPAAPGEQAADEIPWDIAFHIRQLKDKDSLARQISATALGTMGARALPALPALTEALNDEVPAVRTAAAESLKQIRGKSGTKNRKDKR